MVTTKQLSYTKSFLTMTLGISILALYLLYLSKSFVAHKMFCYLIGPIDFIKEHNRLIGPPSDYLADYVPNVGHCMKNCSNSLYDISKKDSSFAGKNLLENNRIKAFIVDIRSALNEYKTRIGNTSDWHKCLQKIYAVVTHHCGDYSKCK